MKCDVLNIIDQSVNLAKLNDEFRVRKFVVNLDCDWQRN